MSDNTETPRLMEIGVCPICRELGASESSIEKYDWPEHTVRLPPAAGKLARVDEREPEEHHALRCPLCGTFYRYDWSYEYLVNGSEDYEDLTRLTPNEARAYLSDEEYGRAMQQMREYLDSADPQTRHFAARSLATGG